MSRTLTEPDKGCVQWSPVISESVSLTKSSLPRMEGVTVCVLKTGLYSDKSFNRIGTSKNNRSSETDSCSLRCVGSAIKDFRGVRLEKTP